MLTGRPAALVGTVHLHLHLLLRRGTRSPDDEGPVRRLVDALVPTLPGPSPPPESGARDGAEGHHQGLHPAVQAARPRPGQDAAEPPQARVEGGVPSRTAAVAREGGPLAVNSMAPDSPPGRAAGLAVQALGHGYATGFVVCAAAALLSCLLALTALRSGATGDEAVEARAGRPPNPPYVPAPEPRPTPPRVRANRC